MSISVPSPCPSNADFFNLTSEFRTYKSEMEIGTCLVAIVEVSRGICIILSGSQQADCYLFLILLNHERACYHEAFCVDLFFVAHLESVRGFGVCTDS